MNLSYLVVLALAGAWCLIIGEISAGQVLLGMIFGALFVLVTGVGTGRSMPQSELYRRLVYLVVYLLILIPYDVVRSNLDMARRILRPKPDLSPGIVRVRLGSVSDAVSALVGHAITMSPGELVVDYSEDGRTVYVHLIDVTEAEVRRASFWRIYHSLLERILE